MTWELRPWKGKTFYVAMILNGNSYMIARDAPNKWRMVERDIDNKKIETTTWPSLDAAKEYAESLTTELLAA